MGLLGNVLKTSSQLVFKYETPKVVDIQSRRIGALYRLVQIVIVTYVIGYVFIHQKGYQETDFVESTVITKIKGAIRTKPPYVLGAEVWDGVDLIVPGQENNAFFIATNVIGTPDQRQGSCPEDINIGTAGIACKRNSDCAADTAVLYGNGYRTGKCSNATQTCEISAWCPVEIDKLPQPALLLGSENFTILVKNQIIFPKFGLKRRNILSWMNVTYLTNCRYHPKTDPFCPIFVLKDIIELANESYAELAERGGMISFVIEWNCDLDTDYELCLPKYSFRRMDDKDDKLAKGYNFRHAQYWTDHNGVQRRTLMKFFGIRFVFNVYGQAGKFCFLVFAMNLGSGLGLLGMASILCDFVMLNLLENRAAFNAHKFTRLESRFMRRSYSSPNISQEIIRTPSKVKFAADVSFSPPASKPISRQSFRPYRNSKILHAIDEA